MQLTINTIKDDRWNQSWKRLPIGSRIFVCFSSFAEKDVPKAAGFMWHPTNRKWYTDDQAVACKLAEWADPSCRAELEAIRMDRIKSIAASRAADADIEIPAPDGMDYLPFQKAGIHYIVDRADRYPRILLGDSMGLGKTIQAIGVINATANIYPVLVVCPASLKINWYREMRKWIVDKSIRIGIGDSNVCPSMDTGFHVTIINYEGLAKNINSSDKAVKSAWKYNHKELRETEWGMVIVDECHNCKNTKALRSKAVYGLKAKRSLFLTGTPILNKPQELYPIIEHCDPDYWKPKYNYYRSHYSGMWIKGVFMSAEEALRNNKTAEKMQANLNDLQDRLRATIMIRRMKEEVLKELPPKRRQIIEFEATGKALEAVNAEKEAMSSREGVLESLRYAVELAKMAEDDAAYAKAVGDLTEAAATAFTEISRVRHETAVAKIPYAISHIESVLEQEKKLVVFAHHHDVIDAIVKAFPGAVKVDGTMDVDARQRSVDAFQLDSKVKVFVGSIKAAGVGLTLTAASTVVFVELDWVPGWVSQAEDRIHRIGQVSPVLVQHLVLEGSLDARMANIIVSKQAIIDAALDNEKRRELDIPEVPTADKVEPVRITRTGLIKEAAEITGDQIEAVHAGLRMLAGMCDGARRVDMAGFNKVDTLIGKSLAEQSRLTPKQAAYGRKLVRKYKRQLPSDILERVAA